MEGETDMSDYFETPWTTTLDDAHGNTWVFRYGGGSNIRIRPTTARSGEWTHGVIIRQEGKTPSTVTDEWLSARAAEWIADREDDPAETRTVA